MYIVTETAPATFDFEIAGEEYSATALQSIPVDMAKEFMDAANGDEIGFTLWVIDHLLPEESRGAVHALPISSAAALVRAYIASSKAEPGE